MTDVVRRFFAELGERGHEPRLERANGALRFDLDGAGDPDGAGDGDHTRAGEGTQRGVIQHWLVDIRRGNVTVSRGLAAADCVVRTDLATFDRLIGGAANGMACMLRNVVRFEGDPELLVLFGRLLAAPSGHGRPVPAAATPDAVARDGRAKRGGGHDSGRGQDPGRQHVRRQRRTR